MFKRTLTLLAFGLSVSSAAHAQNFTTASEVRMILDVTKGNWIAVREFNGNDLVYFTHLESWRCGLDGVMYGINSDIADQVWELEECYEDEGAPNAMKLAERLPFITLELGSVQTVIVQLNYDDGETDTVKYDRNGVMIQ